MKSKKGKYLVLIGCLLSFSEHLLAASETNVNATLNYKYDDNIYKQDLKNINGDNGVEASGSILIKAVALNTIVNRSKFNFVSGLALSESSYSVQPELDNQSYTVNLSAQYLVSYKASVTSSVSSERKLRDFAETDLRKKSEIETNSFELGINYKPKEKISFSSNLNFITNKNSLNELASLDRETLGYSLVAVYQVTSRLSTTGSYTFSQVEPLNGGADLLRYSKLSYGLNLDYSYSPKTNVSLDLGRQTLLDNSSSNYSFNFNYQATPKSKINLTIFKKQVDSTNENSIQSENSGYSFSYNYAYSNRWSYLLSGTVTEQDSDALLLGSVNPYSDDLKNFSLTANYNFNQTLNLSGGYVYQERSSTRAGFDYVSNIYQISSNLKF